jgi:hypothetical protein
VVRVISGGRTARLRKTYQLRSTPARQLKYTRTRDRQSARPGCEEQPKATASIIIGSLLPEVPRAMVLFYVYQKALRATPEQSDQLWSAGLRLPRTWPRVVEAS